MYQPTTIDTLDFHSAMLVDEDRTAGFLRAILRTVKPGEVVLDIGSGTGILAYFACLAGARHVYAVEQGEVVTAARRICAANGLQDRVTFLNTWSTLAELPEKADVLITETIGNIGFEEGILEWVLDARARLLKPDAAIIPGTLSLELAPVAAGEEYAWIDSWLPRYYSFDYAPARSLVVNSPHFTYLSEECLLAEPARVATAVLPSVAGSELQGAATYTINRSGTIHGIGGWFHSELAPGIELTNRPPNRVPSWGHVFFPLERAWPVTPGDELEVVIAACDNAAEWSWRVEITRSDKRRGPRQEAVTHSSRAGQLLAPHRLPAPSRVPAPSCDLTMDRFVLAAVDGRRTVRDIAQAAAARFPTELTTAVAAEAYVQELLLSYDL